MTTLATLKARIQNEIARDDLTTEIAEAITTAITKYKTTERLFFSEGRDNTFTTVASQEFYTSSDASWIPDVLDIDFMTLELGATQVVFLTQQTPAAMEDLVSNSNSSGQPTDFEYFARKFRLYPLASQAWTVRMTGRTLVGEPASDSEADNAWMVEGEALIRSRAKYELAVHVTKDANMAVAMSPETPPAGQLGGYESYRALQELKSRTALAAGTGRIASYDAEDPQVSGYGGYPPWR